MSRDIAAFIYPEKLIMFQNRCKEAGHIIRYSSIDRNLAEQMALYAQGRMELTEVNLYRLLARMSILKSSAENRIVTWTVESDHITDINRPRSRAADYFIVYEGKAIWDKHFDLNVNDIPDYIECGLIAKGMGLGWGGTRSKGGDFPEDKDDMLHIFVRN